MQRILRGNWGVLGSRGRLHYFQKQPFLFKNKRRKEKEWKTTQIISSYRNRKESSELLWAQQNCFFPLSEECFFFFTETLTELIHSQERKSYIWLMHFISFEITRNSAEASWGNALYFCYIYLSLNKAGMINFQDACVGQKNQGCITETGFIVITTYPTGESVNVLSPCYHVRCVLHNLYPKKWCSNNYQAGHAIAVLLWKSIIILELRNNLKKQTVLSVGGSYFKRNCSLMSMQKKYWFLE